MTKKEYVEEFLRQRNAGFRLEAGATLTKWKDKGKNESRDIAITRFVANYNDVYYSCFEVKIHNQKMEMLCLVSDKHCKKDTATVKSVKIDEVFELVNIEYITLVNAFKVDLNKAMYLYGYGLDFLEVNKSIHSLVANELRLVHQVYYDNGTLRVANAKSTLLHYLRMAELEMKKLQYYEEKNGNMFVKYSTVANTLEKGDVGFLELGATEYAVVYSFNSSSVNSQKFVSEKNFFDEKVFVEMCRMHEVAAYNVDAADRETKKMISACKVVERIGDFESLYSEHKKIYYVIEAKEITLYAETNSGLWKKYIIVLHDKFKMKQKKAKLVSKQVKASQAVIKELRQSLIDEYTRNMVLNLLNKDGTLTEDWIFDDGEICRMMYRYDSSHNWLILDNMSTNRDELTIPPVFDAVKPFFKSNLKKLDLSNVQYIVGRASGFNNLENLRYLKGEKLRLTQAIDLATNEMCFDKRNINKYCSSYCLYEHYYNRVAYLMTNDMLYYINEDKCSIYLSSLEFIMSEYSMQGFFEEYGKRQKIKSGRIGYNSQQEYLRLFKNGKIGKLGRMLYRRR